MNDGISISSLHIYPVKSCRGIRLDAASVRRMGFEHDRRWMVTDAAGEFLTQREHPALARVTVALRDGMLHLSTDSDPGPAVPVDKPLERFLPVTVWSNRLDAALVSREADEWFSALLGLPALFVRIPELRVRRVNPAYGGPDDFVSFADAYPVLVTTEDSLADLNGRMETPVPMDRFRPNIVLRGTGAFAEDGWPSIRVRGIRFRFVKPCDRCVVTTTDQTSGERSREPLRTLATYRKRGNSVYFGMNAVPDGEGDIALGDRVEIGG